MVRTRSHATPGCLTRYRGGMAHQPNSPDEPESEKYLRRSLSVLAHVLRIELHNSHLIASVYTAVAIIFAMVSLYDQNYANAVAWGSAAGFGVWTFLGYQRIAEVITKFDDVINRRRSLKRRL